MKPSKEQLAVIEAVANAVKSDSFKSAVRSNIERENRMIRDIEKSLKPSERQYTQVYNL